MDSQRMVGEAVRHGILRPRCCDEDPRQLKLLNLTSAPVATLPDGISTSELVVLVQDAAQPRGPGIVLCQDPGPRPPTLPI